MEIIDTHIDGVKIIQPRVFSDQRGYFMETWNYEKLKQQGLDARFVQDNESRSTKGTLRGIHFQKERPQGKLVRAVQGEVFDVAVDLRKDSPTFGQWTGQVLSEENKTFLWIPPGLGHAYYTMSDIAIFVYKCTDYYQGADQYSLKWNDPDLGIDWPFESDTELTLSDKDLNAPGLSELTGIL